MSDYNNMGLKLIVRVIVHITSVLLVISCIIWSIANNVYLIIIQGKK